MMEEQKKPRAGSLEAKLEDAKRRRDAAVAALAQWDVENRAALAEAQAAETAAQAALTAAQCAADAAVLARAIAIELLDPSTPVSEVRGYGRSGRKPHPKLIERLYRETGLDDAAVAAGAHQRGNQRDDLISQVFNAVWIAFSNYDPVAKAEDFAVVPLREATRRAGNARHAFQRVRYEHEDAVRRCDREIAEIKGRIADRAGARAATTKRDPAEVAAEQARFVEARRKLDEMIKHPRRALVALSAPASQQSDR